MAKDPFMMKILIHLLCCLVPRKKWRKTVKRVLIDDKRRQKELESFGCTLDGDVLTTPEGIRLDISHKADYPLYMIKEVFFKSEYNLNLQKEAILIDIGMNRAAASLRFACDQNIKTIYAYEPFEPTFEMAQKNLEMNPRLSGKIHAVNVGLGRADATLELPYLDTATGGMSTTYNVCKDKKKAKKEIVIIHDAADEFRRILGDRKNQYVIVKCDCEGAEYEIFERLNAENLMGRLDVVMMEYHFEKPDKLVFMFTENGFAVQVRAGSSKSKTGYIYAVRMADQFADE
jgi:FkbM family methyltransferase